jgi:homoserine O-acetyltransferase
MEYRIGRNADNEIVINKQSVSRYHGVLRITENGIIYEDLGSSNGSFINGNRVSGPVLIKERDIIKLDLQTKQPFGNNFPFLTIHDMVRAQNLLIEHFGIAKLHAVIGGSTGGMQVLAWGVLFPNKVKILIPMATSYRHSPQNIAFHEVGRQAIMSDPNWCEGDYLINEKFPKNGLAIARMTAHITYLSETSLQKKFGRDLNNKAGFSFSAKRDFDIKNGIQNNELNLLEPSIIEPINNIELTVPLETSKERPSRKTKK